MKVSALYIYPIKSLQGVSVSQAEVLVKGFRHDRRWMLIDETNQQLTQRTHPQLSQIKISLTKQGIQASHEGFANLQLPLELQKGEELSVKIWGDKVTAWSYSPVADAWFSKVSGTHCRLVYMPENADRPINRERARNGENVSFADGYPYLIIGERSLADLNERMETPLPMNRFRPNVVFNEGEVYEEDTWETVKIADINFYGCHPCVRCVFTTVDQETGEKGKEPLRTLASYRSVEDGVIFGVNAIANNTGKIRVGDLVSPAH